MYQEDAEQWWKIYHHTIAKPKARKNFNDVTLFLRLWSGSTDGKMTEGLVTNTDEILVKNSLCFFEGILGLSKQEIAAFITHYWLLTEPGPIAMALKQALENTRYRDIAAQLLQETCIQVTDWQNYARHPRLTLTNYMTATIIQHKRTQKQHGEIV
ncbi:hypothetical protein SAMN06296273_0793 [Nitrosomonas ureae]|uniref:Uncharacterized protein n=1 Tax=Nitrosomonas ureae TaxID=44577 RepID=A0A285BW83_9PROT|nr:hypothetical protein SAMN06296273_0793 [Nitrosomonas ureae]